MQGRRGPFICSKANPTNGTAVHSSARNARKSSLTLPGVTRCAVLVGIVAARAGLLVVALQNYVALVRGTEVAFLECQIQDGGTDRRGGDAEGWLCTDRVAVNSDLFEYAYAIASGGTPGTDFIEARTTPNSLI